MIDDIVIKDQLIVKAEDPRGGVSYSEEALKELNDVCVPFMCEPTEHEKPPDGMAMLSYDEEKKAVVGDIYVENTKLIEKLKHVTGFTTIGVALGSDVEDHDGVTYVKKMRITSVAPVWVPIEVEDGTQD